MTTLYTPLSDFDPPREPPGAYVPFSDFAKPAPIRLKTAAQFAAEYEPLSYTIAPFLRSASLYTLTARTGAGKTALNVIAALAVATGRADIVGREVHQGRVAYLACENPDDIRMRFKIAAFLLSIDLDEIAEGIVILDRRERPEDVCAALAWEAERGAFALVIVDTLAAFFDGDDINNAVQGGQFMRRLRPLTQISGKPSVLVSAHPVKSASEDNLVPYGSGAILNEVDGNLTLWKRADSGALSLHWQGKLRGLDFDPAMFRLEICGSPDILDDKGRQVELPTMRPATVVDAEERERVENDTGRALLRAMLENPSGTQRDWGETISRTPSIVNRKLQQLRRDKLAAVSLGKWSVTAAGRKAAVE